MARRAIAAAIVVSILLVATTVYVVASRSRTAMFRHATYDGALVMTYRCAVLENAEALRANVQAANLFFLQALRGISNKQAAAFQHALAKHDSDPSAVTPTLVRSTRRPMPTG